MTKNPYGGPDYPAAPAGVWNEGYEAGFAAGRAAATPDGWTPTSDAPDAPGWECELCGGKLDGPGEKCGSAQHGPAGSVVYGRAVPAGSLDVGDEPDERFAPPGDADRVTHGLVPPSVDLRDEDAIRRDERERLSARVYENGWCPTCATKTADPGVIPGPDPGACPVCGGWRKAGLIHRCPPGDARRPWPIAPDTVMPPRRQPVRWGSRADDPPTDIHDDPQRTKAYLAGLAAGRTEARAASPDERLREADRAALVESIAQTERFRGGPCLCSDCVEKRADAEATVDAVLAALAATDRDKQEGER